MAASAGTTTASVQILRILKPQLRSGTKEPFAIALQEDRARSGTTRRRSSPRYISAEVRLFYSIAAKLVPTALFRLCYIDSLVPMLYLSIFWHPLFHHRCAPHSFTYAQRHRKSHPRGKTWLRNGSTIYVPLWAGSRSRKSIVQ